MSTAEQHPCAGCRAWDQIQGEHVCTDQQNWGSYIPANPPCHITREEEEQMELQVIETMVDRSQKLAELMALFPVDKLSLMAQIHATDALLKGDELEAVMSIERGALLLALQLKK